MSDEKVLETVEAVDSDTAVTVSRGITYNLGDYNSMRTDVSVTWPCKLSEIDEAFEKADSWVKSKCAVMRPKQKKV